MGNLFLDFQTLLGLSFQLRNFKVVDPSLGKANFSCPLCGDSQKSRSKARGYTFPGKDSLMFHCHNCGQSKNFSQFLQILDRSVWERWRLEKADQVTNFPLCIEPPRIEAVQKKFYEHMCRVSELPEGHLAKEYVGGRRIPPSRYELLWYTEDFSALVREIFPTLETRYRSDSRLVMPIFNRDAQIVALSGRLLGDNADANYRYRKAPNGDAFFFGLERVNFSKPVLVVEGAIDSLFLANSVAVGSADLLRWDKTYPTSHSILILDNEPTNEHIVGLMEKAVDSGAIVCFWLNCPFNGKDINEMVLHGASVRDLIGWILGNSFSGDRARLRLLKWKAS